MEQISAAAVRAWLDDPKRHKPILLDVREHWEVELCQLPSALHIPMGQVPTRLEELDAGAHIVVYCHRGARSARVALFLKSRGIDKVFNLAGGISAWAEEVDPGMATY